MDMVGLASIIPVVSLLVDFEAAVSEGYLLSVYNLLERPGKPTFQFGMMLLAVALIWFSGIVGVLAIYARQRYLKRVSTDLASRVYRRYMSLSIEQFYKKSSAEFLRDVNGVSERISIGVLDSSIVILSRGFQIMLIISILLVVDVRVTLIIVAAISVSYLAVFLGLRRFVTRIARENFESTKRIQQILLGSYHAYRNLHIDNQLPEYSSRFSALKKDASTKAANVEILGAIPKEFIEVIGLTMMVFSAYWIGQSASAGHNFVATMTLMGLAAFRVLPSAQQSYHSFNRLVSALEVYNRVKHTWGDLLEKISTERNYVSEKKYSSIIVENLSYRNDVKWIFKDININIDLKGMYWFSGESGVGKSTLMDLLAYLRIPSSGRILVDGENLLAVNKRQWWQSLSYVSQESYIFEASIRENIILSYDFIDEYRLNTVARICDLMSIGNSAECEFDFKLLEGGKNLSGGQRSKLLIARALYKKSQIIILDETLSSIDAASAKKILNDILMEFNDRCVFLVSHREIEIPDIVKEIKLAGDKV